VVIGGTSYDLLVGPTMQTGQQAALQLNVSTAGTAPIAVTPKVSIYALDYSGQPLVTSSAPAATINPGKTAQPVSIDLSSLVTKPGVYVGQAVLTDASGSSISPIIFFRYIIAGAVYNIRSVSADKTAVTTGGTVNVTVGYSGTPAPINPAASTSPAASADMATVAVTLFNERGQQVGAAQQDVDFDQGNSISLPVTVTAAAAALRVGASITKNGVAVATYGSDLSPDFAAQAQKAANTPVVTSSSKSQAMLEGAGFVVLAILILGLIWLARRHSRNGMNQPPTQPPMPPFSPTAMMLAILVGASALLLGAGTSRAAMTVTPVAHGERQGTIIKNYNPIVFTLNRPSNNVPITPSGVTPVVTFPLSFNLVAYGCDNNTFDVLYYVQYGNGSEDAYGQIGSGQHSGSHTQRLVANGPYGIGPGNNNNSDHTTGVLSQFTPQAGQNTMTIYLVVGLPSSITPSQLPSSYAAGKFPQWLASQTSDSYLVVTLSPITDTMPTGSVGNVINPLQSNATVPGWACDVDDPAATTLVDIYMATGSNPLQPAYWHYPANAQNSDPNTSSATIASNCGGTTAHAFLVPIPVYWQEDAPTTLTIKAFARNVNSLGETPYDYVNSSGGSDPEPYPPVAGVPLYGGSSILPVRTITPPTPVAPTASGVCVNNIPALSLSWSSMTDSQSVSGDTLSQGVAGYQLQISTNSTFDPESTKKIADQNTTQATISGTDSTFNPSALTINASTQYYARIVYVATGAVGATANATTPASCGSGGGGAPVVNFGTSANVYPGGSIALTWTAVNPTQGIAPTHWWNWFLPSAYADSSGITCTASNDSGGLTDPTTGWSGSGVGANGSRLVGPISDNSNHKITFNLTCTNSSGSTTPPPVVATIVNNGGGGNPPTVSLSFSQNGNPCPSSGGGACTPVCGAPVTLNWNVTDSTDNGTNPQVDYCVPTGGDSTWSSSEITSSNYNSSYSPVPPVSGSGSRAYTLTCFNSAKPPVTTSGVSASVTINAPTGNCTTSTPGNSGTTGGSSFPF